MNDRICDATAFECSCLLPLGHEGAHECGDFKCAGQWSYDEAGEFVAVKMPLPGRDVDVGSLIGAIFGFDDDEVEEDAAVLDVGRTTR